MNIRGYLFWGVVNVPPRSIVDDSPVGLESKEHRTFEQRHFTFKPQRRPETLNTPRCSTGASYQRVGAVHHGDEHVEHDDRRQTQICSEHHVQHADVASCLSDNKIKTRQLKICLSPSHDMIRKFLPAFKNSLPCQLHGTKQKDYERRTK